MKLVRVVGFTLMVIGALTCGWLVLAEYRALFGRWEQ